MNKILWDFLTYTDNIADLKCLGLVDTVTEIK